VIFPLKRNFRGKIYGFTSPQNYARLRYLWNQHTIYRGTLIKGKLDKSWPNCQTKAIQYKDTIYFQYKRHYYFVVINVQRESKLNSPNFNDVKVS